MKRIILLLIGFLPLLFGYIQNHLMMTIFFDRMTPVFLIGIAVLTIWFFIGMLSKIFANSKKEAVILINAPAFLVLLLILLQEVVLNAFWSNHLGIATQFFYLPLIGFTRYLSFIFPIITFSLLSVIAFICLLGASYLGRVVVEQDRRYHL